MIMAFSIGLDEIGLSVSSDACCRKQKASKYADVFFELSVSANHSPP